ncbi:hypothetical protein [Micromonospora lupini]|uniref:Uncharacterized protein n=1 Tax=Micromonospora lupini str. Lupac 08 TaxID=1150864 RepID=I0L3P5_9ACTN|nr:hypothetical protein [Micromonospora lupini]CCH18442.1 hypothetical protein MILUP08_43352 [Micromonospora lupini str. Lupac 08]
METIVGLGRLLWRRPKTHRQAPAPSGTGQAIQEREQQAAHGRILAYARRMPHEQRMCDESRVASVTAWKMSGHPAHVSLRPGEWQSSPGVEGRTDQNIRIVSVHQSHDQRYAWVYGHTLECEWESADCNAPFCRELLVDVDVLAANAAGGWP